MIKKISLVLIVVCFYNVVYTHNDAEQTSLILKIGNSWEPTIIENQSDCLIDTVNASKDGALDVLNSVVTIGSLQKNNPQHFTVLRLFLVDSEVVIKEIPDIFDYVIVYLRNSKMTCYTALSRKVRIVEFDDSSSITLFNNDARPIKVILGQLSTESFLNLKGSGRFSLHEGTVKGLLTGCVRICSRASLEVDPALWHLGLRLLRRIK